MSEDPKPNADGGKPEAEDTSALKKALTEERQARKELERLVKAQETAKADEKAAADKAEMERKGEWEKLKLAVEAEKAQLLKEKDEAALGLKSYLLKAELTTAIAANKGNPHLLKLVQDQFEVLISPDGAHKVFAKGDPTKTPSTFIEGLKKDASYGAFFEASGASGSGSSQGSGSHTSAFAQMTKTELAMAVNNPATRAAAEAFLNQK